MKTFKFICGGLALLSTYILGCVKPYGRADLNALAVNGGAYEYMQARAWQDISFALQIAFFIGAVALIVSAFKFK